LFRSHIRKKKYEKKKLPYIFFPNLWYQKIDPISPKNEKSYLNLQLKNSSLKSLVWKWPSFFFLNSIFFFRLLFCTFSLELLHITLYHIQLKWSNKLSWEIFLIVVKFSYMCLLWPKVWFVCLSNLDSKAF
jgi:hypothetical protein